jgi:16S rRNA (uracil1498-N3)-methyltransferase
VSLTPHVLVAEPLDGLVTGQDVVLEPARAHHLRRVLRLGDGAPLSITDGLGRHAASCLDGDRARLTEDVVSRPAVGPRVVLVQALSKGRRAEDAVRTACELGVDRLVPVVADRTQGRPDARASAGVVERWRAVAAAALEQSRGHRLADVDPPVATRTLAAEPAGSGVVRLVAVPGAAPLPDVLADVLTAARAGSPATDVHEVAVAIGPEGGWSAAEVDVLVASGWLPVGLGPTVLRTEHAGPVAVAVIAAATGRWREDSAVQHGTVDAALDDGRLPVRPSWSTDAL